MNEMINIVELWGFIVNKSNVGEARRSNQEWTIQIQGSIIEQKTQNRREKPQKIKNKNNKILLKTAILLVQLTVESHVLRKG